MQSTKYIKDLLSPKIPPWSLHFSRCYCFIKFLEDCLKILLVPEIPASYQPRGFFLVARLVKNLPAMWKTWVQSLGWEDPLEKGKATHSSILAWRISWNSIVHEVAQSRT